MVAAVFGTSFTTMLNIAEQTPILVYTSGVRQKCVTLQTSPTPRSQQHYNTNVQGSVFPSFHQQATSLDKT